MKTAAIILLSICAAAFAQQIGSFKDDRDGKTYKTTKIGEQIWFAENLSYNAEGSLCYEGGAEKISADSVAKSCATYGRLYKWDAAKKACPDAWHLPTKAEWDILTATLGGEKAEDKHLMAKYVWDFKNQYKSFKGEDTYGFAALQGGSATDYGSFIIYSMVGLMAGFWSATEHDAKFAYRRHMSSDNSYIELREVSKDNLFSVRCVKDLEKKENKQ